MLGTIQIQKGAYKMRIGFIGLGIMGESMSKRIIGYHNDDVYIFDINEDKLKKLEKAGGIRCESSQELARKSDVIISMVPTAKHTREVYDDIQNELKQDKIWIDMSTISPINSKEIGEKVRNLGAEFLDAPVVKSKQAAIDGDLGIYVGGNKETYQKIKSILEYMGSNIIYMGESGNGLVMKICHNALVGQIQNGVNETLSLARKMNISVDDFVTAISYGGGSNFYLTSKAESIKNEDYKTAFSIENMNKDINICLDLAKDNNFRMPGVDIVHEVYSKAMDCDFAKDDFSKTYEIVRNR